MTSSLDFYLEPSQPRVRERFAKDLDELADVGQLAKVVAELVVYDIVAPDFYGLQLAEDQAQEIHLRSVEEILAHLDGRGTVGLRGREPQSRVVGRCHHYVRLMVELLRAKGIPARARCGFGAYFNPPRFEDHWICEYWDEGAGRWRLVDAQFDDAWRKRLVLAFDHLDVPRDQFVVAADAWHMCRGGDVDPTLFGISFVPLAGLWYVAGNLIRDAAALNGVQMLPWDFWGAVPAPDHTLNEDELEFFDHLAGLTRGPDTSFAELRRVYTTDDRITVPATVFNGLRNQHEPV